MQVTGNSPVLPVGPSTTNLSTDKRPTPIDTTAAAALNKLQQSAGAGAVTGKVSPVKDGSPAKKTSSKISASTGSLPAAKASAKKTTAKTKAKGKAKPKSKSGSGSPSPQSGSPKSAESPKGTTEAAGSADKAAGAGAGAGLSASAAALSLGSERATIKLPTIELESEQVTNGRLKKFEQLKADLLKRINDLDGLAGQISAINKILETTAEKPTADMLKLQEAFKKIDPQTMFIQSSQEFVEQLENLKKRLDAEKTTIEAIWKCNFKGAFDIPLLVTTVPIWRNFSNGIGPRIASIDSLLSYLGKPVKLEEKATTDKKPEAVSPTKQEEKSEAAATKAEDNKLDENALDAAIAKAAPQLDLAVVFKEKIIVHKQLNTARNLVEKYKPKLEILKKNLEELKKLSSELKHHEKNTKFTKLSRIIKSIEERLIESERELAPLIDEKNRKDSGVMTTFSSQAKRHVKFLERVVKLRQGLKDAYYWSCYASPTVKEEIRNQFARAVEELMNDVKVYEADRNVYLTAIEATNKTISDILVTLKPLISKTNETYNDIGANLNKFAFTTPKDNGQVAVV